MDPYEHLQISLNPDGSLSRRANIPLIPPSTSPSAAGAALSRDVPLNPARDTSLRLYLPNPNPNPNPKLPVVLYFHGGGFVLFSPASGLVHLSSAARSASIPALVASVAYRLAPEHRLPAAYDDAVDALLFLRDQALNPTDPWLGSHADFSNVSIMGSSAGGNVAFHLGLRSMDLNLTPLKINGLILNQPFFGGKARVKSEARSGEDKILPLAVNDLMWELALPAGADRDHEYCDPTRVSMEEGGRLPRVLVRGFGGDPLIDRQREFVRAMEGRGVRVEVSMQEGGFHGVELVDEGKAAALVEDCRRFIYG